MSAQRSSLESADYFFDMLATHADRGFQFAFGVLLNRQKAIDVINHVYQKFAEDLPLPSSQENTALQIFSLIWEQIQRESGQVEESPLEEEEYALLQGVYRKLSSVERAALILRDHFGYTDAQGMAIVAFDEQKWLQSLTTARQVMVEEGGDIPKESDDVKDSQQQLQPGEDVTQRFFTALDLILNDEHPSALQETCAYYLQEPRYSALVEGFRQLRGELQNLLGSQRLQNDELIHLRGLAQSMDSNQDREKVIEKDLKVHEIANLRHRRIRQGLIYGVPLLLLFLVAKNFAPESTVEFRPVEALAAETQLLEANIYDEQRLQLRYELVTSDAQEVREYFTDYPDPDSEFEWSATGRLLDIPHNFWTLNVAHVIDYDEIKDISLITMVAYYRLLSGEDEIKREQEVMEPDGTYSSQIVVEKISRKDVLVHYSFTSERDFLPEFQAQSYNGTQYYTFETDDYNIIMWRHYSEKYPDRYHLIFGRIKPLDMISLIPQDARK